MANILIGGMQHETNTFAPVEADLQAFGSVSFAPQMPRGQRLLDEMRGLNLPIGGFIDAAEALGHRLLPSLWAMAVPSSYVTDDAFETITGEILEDISTATKLDAVYLCLHGAMVTRSHQDGEGEFLRRVRSIIGPSVPLVISLDLHANTTTAMFEAADAMVAYRTYPHVDMAQTGARAARLLNHMLTTERRPAKACRRVEFLIPLVWQCSLMEPAQTIYSNLDAMDGAATPNQRIGVDDGVWSASFTPGFPPADIAECGPAIFAYADDDVSASRTVDAVYKQVVDARGAWNGRLWEPSEAIRHARANYIGRPYVLADTQDNPGAGGASDTVGVLEALVAERADDAIFGVVYDPQAARAAHSGGVGAELSLSLGAKSGQAGQAPFRGLFTVEALSEGEFAGTGPMAIGVTFRMGLCAVLRIGGVKVLVGSARAQVKDQAIFRHIGLDPSAVRIVALKSSVHFRADFQAMAQDVLIVVSPGPNMADHLAMPYQHLRRGLLLTPDGPAFS